MEMFSVSRLEIAANELNSVKNDWDVLNIEIWKQELEDFRFNK